MANNFSPQSAFMGAVEKDCQVDSSNLWRVLELHQMMSKPLLLENEIHEVILTGTAESEKKINASI